MFTKAASFFAFCLYASSSVASAINLRNGPKDLGVDLGGSFVGRAVDGADQANRKLAMQGVMMRELADFDWDLDLEPDFPQISFEGADDSREVRFLYNYTGTTVPNTKFISHQLFQGDCKTPASPGAIAVTFEEDITANQEYQVDIDVLQESVTGTPEYTDIDVTAAMINFCVRVDYIYNDGTTDESINFHETNVTINIDLTANFTLTAISVDRIDADQVDEDVALDCEVQAYFCDQDNVNVGQPLFVQGEIMTVCVEIADSDRALYHLNDVMEMDLAQTKRDGITVDQSDIVTDQRATGLSDKFCKNGICNIRHQLASKFFDERDPNNLDIAGIAICAFGPLSTFTRRVNRDYLPAFKTEAGNNEVTMLNVESVETCKADCLAIPECQSFSAVMNADGTFNCALITGAYPRDEDLAEDGSVIVYTRNDATAIAA